MNTQEKELRHCTACNQMTNHSGETCLKHTPDTEENAYSRGYKQGRFDAEMDRLNEEKHTPDTEWVRVLQDKARDYFLLWEKEAKKLRVKPDELFFHLIDPLVEELVQQIRDARDTYWKEGVRKASYEIVKEFQDNLITIAIENEHLRGCVTSNQIIQAFKDFEANTHPALTNEDNLK